jgi:hypothetical protein
MFLAKQLYVDPGDVRVILATLTADRTDSRRRSARSF